MIIQKGFYHNIILIICICLSIFIKFEVTADAKSATFRASAGIILINASGQVLALERCDIPGAWQMPQGGIDEGEDILAATKRELYEETRIDFDSKIQLLNQHPDWLAYQLPKPSKKHGLGQVQKWTLFLFKGEDADIDLEAATPKEFCAYKWTTLRELSNESVWFRKGIYKQLANYFSKYLAE